MVGAGGGARPARAPRCGSPDDDRGVGRGRADGLVFLFLTALAPAPLAKALGLAEEATARVTGKHYTNVTGPRSGCDFYRIEVEWPGRTGHFTVCNNPDHPATRLEVGDRVQIAAVPWSSEVAGEGTEGTLFWSATGLLAGVVLLPLGLLWVRRYRRLAAGTASGVQLSGRVTKVTRNAVRVELGTPGTRGHTLVLLPAKRPVRVAVDDQVGVWSTRRTLLSRRPAGPWVLAAEGRLAAYTHGWRRRSAARATRD